MLVSVSRPNVMPGGLRFFSSPWFSFDDGPSLGMLEYSLPCNPGIEPFDLEIVQLRDELPLLEIGGISFLVFNVLTSAAAGQPVRLVVPGQLLCCESAVGFGMPFYPGDGVVAASEFVCNRRMQVLELFYGRLPAEKFDHRLIVDVEMNWSVRGPQREVDRV